MAYINGQKVISLVQTFNNLYQYTFSISITISSTTYNGTFGLISTKEINLPSVGAGLKNYVKDFVNNGDTLCLPFVPTEATSNLNAIYINNASNTINISFRKGTSTMQYSQDPIIMSCGKCKVL